MEECLVLEGMLRWIFLLFLSSLVFVVAMQLLWFYKIISLLSMIGLSYLIAITSAPDLSTPEINYKSYSMNDNNGNINDHGNSYPIHTGAYIYVMPLPPAR